MSELRVETVARQRIDFPRIPGITSAGLMAVTPRLKPGQLFDLSQPTTVDARGLMDEDPATSRSCVFQGTLDNGRLSVDKVLLSPETHPLPPGVSGHLKGYEDQTYAWEEVNFRSPGTAGLYGTQAVMDENNRWKTNIFHYNLATGAFEIAFTPEQARERGLGEQFPGLRMVKEPQFWLNGQGQLRILMECNESFTFMGIGDAKNNEITNLRPFLMPTAGTWYSDHCAPAADPMPLGDGTYLLVFNGRSSPPDHPKGVWAHGALRIDEEGNILWISSDPWVLPPMDEEPGPGGQNIAFASVYLAERNGDGLLLRGFHHPQDRYVEMVTLRVPLG